MKSYIGLLSDFCMNRNSIIRWM